MNKYLLLLLIPFTAFSQSINFKEGVGITKTLDGNIVAFSLGYEAPFQTKFLQKFELGTWIDNHKNEKNAQYGAYSLGMKVNPSNLYISMFLGGAYVTKTDRLLGSHLEFSHDLAVGLEDKGKAIGLTLKHFSNAGLKKPNLGRNLFQLEVKVPI